MRIVTSVMMGWRHSEFNVYCGSIIQPGEEEAMENLADQEEQW